MSVTKPTPRDFPVMHTVKEWNRYRRDRNGNVIPFSVCGVCHLAVSARNRAPHQKACARRKRQDPEMWAEWRADMRESS